MPHRDPRKTGDVVEDHGLPVETMTRDEPDTTSTSHLETDDSAQGRVVRVRRSARGGGLRVRLDADVGCSKHYPCEEHV